MLDSSKKRNYDETKVVTIIGPGTVLTGEIQCKGTVRIEGDVVGCVHSEDTVVVLETGRVKGDLIAAQIVLGGQIEGNVFAKERLEVTAKARLVGDITAPRVSIADGVLFEGRCTMKPPGQGPQPPAPTGGARIQPGPPKPA